MGTIKSRPVYERLRIDPAGRAHLIVSDLAAIPEDALGASPEDTMEPNPSLRDVDHWVVALRAPGIAVEPSGPVRAFRAVADLLAHLSHRLAREAVGLRVYAVGSEAFLWDVMNLGRAAGMSSGEIFLNHAGSSRRRVYCTHCKSMNEEVATNIVACRGCGAHLFVRDHFSRRLAAFMGVIADAEVPGELPAVEVVFP